MTADATTVIPQTGTRAALPVATGARDRQADPLARAFQAEEAAGLLLAFLARLVVLAISAAWLWFYITDIRTFAIVMACFAGFTANA